MKTIAIILALFLCISCSKDDDKNTDDDGGGGAGTLSGFTFDGENYTTDRGEYFNADENSYLFFMNSDINIVANTSFIFSKDFGMLGNGTYTFMEDRFDPNYNPDSNFWTGSVSLDDGIPKNVTGGEITLNKQGDGSYVVSYSVNTADGNAIGDYSGTITPR